MRVIGISFLPYSHVLLPLYLLTSTIMISGKVTPILIVLPYSGKNNISTTVPLVYLNSPNVG